MPESAKALALTSSEQEALQSKVQNLVDKAMQSGATEVEVSASQSRGYAVEVRLGEVDKLEYTDDKGLGLTVYFGQQKGSASSSDLSDAALDQILTKACSIAKYTGEDDCAGLPEKEHLAFDYPDCDLSYEWDLTPHDAIEFAKACEKHGMAQDKRINNSEGASIDTSQGFRVFANSAGFLGSYSGSRHSFSCVLLATGKDGNMERDYEYTVAHDPKDVLSSNWVAEQAARKTVARLDAKKIKTGSYPIIFQADVASGLIGHLLGAIQGSRLYRKSTYLLDALGKPVISPFITLHENPHLQKGIASAPFDGEGVRTTEKDLVKDGILQSYCLSSYSGRKLGMPTTGHASGTHNIEVQAQQTIDASDMLKQMHTGLLVTDVMGQGINMVTGDYSRGATGFWVENGEIVHPVSEITIAGNLQDMFTQIIAVGNDVDRRRGTVTGSMLVEAMTVAGE